MVRVPMLEVEAKIRVQDIAAVRRRLKDAGARRIGVEEQEDAYFAHPTRDLAARDEALRLRLGGGAGVGPRRSFELTFKGPREPGDTKARVEHTVSCASDPTRLLESLGFRVAARLRKRREHYELMGAAVALDRLSGLGDFLEAEVVATQAKSAARKVERVLAELGLAREPRLRESYLELALAAGAAAATRV
jgi:adenylate cyclase class 2